MDVDLKAQERRFTNNLAVLDARSKKLAERLREQDPSQRLELRPASSFGLTACTMAEDGQEVLLASAHDPRAEAKRWLAGLDDLDETKHTVVVVGCGLGYHIAELLKQRLGGLVVVLASNLAEVDAALRCNDFCKDLLLRRLVFVVAGARADLFEPLYAHNVELMLGTKLSQHPASGRAWPKACKEMHRIFTEYLQYARSALTTSLQISAISCDNVLKNLPYYLRYPGVAPLKDLWKGRPGFCVAAGPSLRKNMHLLRQVKGRGPIISVQTVLRTLLGAGIRPDFITSLDYSEHSARFYEDLPALDDITLVADPKVNPIVPRSFPGPTRMFFNGLAQQVLREMDNDHEPLQAGATVAHLNLYLARFLGCDPIILIGQDLGFGENVYYTPGTPIQKAWSVELNRFHTMEMMEWYRIVRERHVVRMTPGQDGRDMYTDAQMFTYLQQFERDVANTPALVINATEGGARISGAEQMTLAEAIKRYCPPEPGPAVPAVAVLDDAPKRTAKAIESLRLRLEELERMEEICRKVLTPLRKMTDALDDPAKFNRLHAKMDQWRVKIDDIKETYALVSSVAQLAELKRMQADRRQQRVELDEIAERREQLARDIQYVSMLEQAIGMLRTSMNDAIAGLEASS